MQLDRLRDTFDSHGLRVSRGKTEIMPCPYKGQTIYIQEKEVKTINTCDGSGGAEKDVNKRVKKPDITVEADR